MALRTLSTFTGGCGLELGLELAFPGALEPVMYVENEVAVAGVLAALMEAGLVAEAPVWSDVRTVTHAEPRAYLRARGGVEVITGGYPCQNFSTAGSRRGLAGEKGRLWYSLRRAIRRYRPGVCLLENVGGHLRRGFDRVRLDLRRLGYAVEAGLFTAKEVGDSQNRERLFILGYLRQRPGSVADEQQREVQGTFVRSAGMRMAVERGERGEPLAHGEGDSGEVLLLQGRPRQARPEPVGRGGRLAGPAGDGRRQGTEDVCAGKPEPPGPGHGLAGAERDDLRHEPGGRGGPGRKGEAIPAYVLPLFPPGPGLTRLRVKCIRGLLRKDPVRAREVFEAELAETRRWAEVVAVAPELAPAVTKEAEPALRELAHGLARTDVLRILGNGVVPLQAAYAFSSLVAAAGWTE